MSKYVDITIIGSGVVGLAVGAAVAGLGRDIYLLEKNNSFGLETSSRNSQVIHSGLYYPEGTLKAKTCVEGNSMIYKISAQNEIAHKRITKIIVANNEKETVELEELKNNGERNGVAGLRLLTKSEVKRLEPNVNAAAALFVPSTGIIDVHELMKYFFYSAKNNGVKVVFNEKVTGIKKINEGFEVQVTDGGGNFNFKTRILINCAGLYAQEIAEMAGIDTIKSGYKVYYCKGEYFKVADSKSKMVTRLVYPVPPIGLTGVGIHVTIDFDGRMRLGPGVKYIDTIDYSVDESKKMLFYENVKRFLPFLSEEDLTPEMAGIRPKLQGPGQKQRDFIISHEKEKDLAGLINLIGIESPGLTASPAIADLVRNIVRNIVRKIN